LFSVDLGGEKQDISRVLLARSVCDRVGSYLSGTFVTKRL